MDQIRVVPKQQSNTDIEINSKPRKTFLIKELELGNYSVNLIKKDNTIFEPFNYEYKLTKILKNHSGSINSIKIYEDKIIAGSKDNSISIWDINTLKKIKTLSGHNNSITSIFIDSGKILSASKDNTIKVWDLETFELNNTLIGHQDYVNTISVKSGKIFSGSEDEKIIVWDLETGKLLKTLSTGSNYFEDDVIMKLFVYKNKLITGSGVMNKEVKVYNLDTDQEEFSLLGHNYYISTIYAKSNKLYSGSGLREGEIKVWDLETGNLLHEFLGHDRTVREIIVSNKELLTVSDDQNFKTWGLDNYQLNKVFKVDNGSIYCLDVNQNKVVLGISNGSIIVLDKKPVHDCQSISMYFPDVNKTEFDTDDDFELKKLKIKNDFFERLVSYDHILIGKCNLVENSYDLDNKKLSLNCLVNCKDIVGLLNIDSKFLADINIDRFRAKEMFGFSRTFDLYLQFQKLEDKLSCNLCLIYSGIKFSLNF